ncbi:MAG TPA: MBL fold metallo-hydrolase [Catalimonadaceae bacterium]|nr:MBL fold metallo-hydrolase [Catalimonadaceae bacterium]
MLVEQIYTQCLAQGAYYVESDGEAAVIDPLREFGPYMELARKRNAKIKYIFETHFHADFVSGHVDLAKETGATIVYGPTAMKTGFDALIGKDGQEFQIGSMVIRLIHTPGHTMESSCFLLIDEDGKEKAIFTGDTLFIGDVGRPDLAQHVIADMTQEKLAHHLYHSLKNKILPLADDIIVYPGHGAGSACGKNLSKETSDTLGHQKESNAALRPGLSEEQFIKELLSGLMPPPGYFPKNVLMNIGGYESINDVLNHGLTPLSPQEFKNKAEELNAIILDTRSAKSFGEGFIPGAVNIGLEGNFAPWVGAVLPDINQPIVFISEPGKEEDVVVRLARVGYDHAVGFLQGGMDAWKKSGFSVDTVTSVDAITLADLREANPYIQILDVRKKSEYDSEHIIGVNNAPLDYIDESKSVVPADGTVYVHCAGGYRSMIFISLMKQKGFHNLVNVADGFSGIKNSGRFGLTEYVCPSTML